MSKFEFRNLNLQSLNDEQIRDAKILVSQQYIYGLTLAFQNSKNEATACFKMPNHFFKYQRNKTPKYEILYNSAMKYEYI